MSAAVAVEVAEFFDIDVALADGKATADLMAGIAQVRPHSCRPPALSRPATLSWFLISPCLRQDTGVATGAGIPTSW